MSYSPYPLEVRYVECPDVFSGDTYNYNYDERYFNAYYQAVNMIP
jgi:hypothetical protein